MRWWILVLVICSLVVLPQVAEAASSVSVTINATPDYLSITNAPVAWNIGAIEKSTVHWAHGNTTPAFPLDNGNCTFTITNNAPVNVDVDIKGGNFTAGSYQWTLSPAIGADAYVMKVGINGTANLGAMKTLTESYQEFVSDLGLSGNTTKWEAVLYAPSSFASSATVSGKIYLSARVVS